MEDVRIIDIVSAIFGVNVQIMDNFIHDVFERIAQDVLPGGGYAVRFTGEAEKFFESGNALLFAYLLAILVVYLRSPLPVYGTLWILLIAYLTKHLPYGMRYASASIHRTPAT